MEQYALSNEEITILKKHAEEFQKWRETETQRYKTIKIIKILGCYCIVIILKNSSDTKRHETGKILFLKSNVDKFEL